MKRVIPCLLIGLLASTAVWADLHIRDNVRHESSFLGIVSTSEPGDPEELWIGARRAALTQQGYTFIVNLDASLFYFVNHRSRSYVEASLPVDLDAIRSVNLNSLGLPRATTGTVQDTGDTRQILDRECRGYEVSIWSLADDDAEPRTFRVWSTTDVSVDTAVVDVLLDTMRLIFGRDEALRSELGKIPGVQMSVELTMSGFPTTRRYVTEAVEIAEEQPLAGTYLPPEGYTKKTQLVPEDF